MSGRYHHEGVIDGRAYGREVRICALPEHFVPPGIDRIDRAGIAVPTQESLRPRSILAVIARSTYQRNRAWGEESLRKSLAGYRPAHR
jgi:hypothetical protein